MLPENKVECFSRELDWIPDKPLRAFCEYALREVPDYFFEIPASSTGKYHPAYTLGAGGLVRHTRAAMAIFRQLCKGDIDLYYFSDVYAEEPIDRDEFQSEVYTALLFHDTHKWGVTDHTVHEHPLIAATFVAEQAQKQKFTNQAAILRICDCIRTHMGKWCISQYSPYMLPTPDSGTWQNKLVHLCDFLASRRDITYHLGGALCDATDGK